MNNYVERKQRQDARHWPPVRGDEGATHPLPSCATQPLWGRLYPLWGQHHPLWDLHHPGRLTHHHRVRLVHLRAQHGPLRYREQPQQRGQWGQGLHGQTRA